jgi:hypothetical protein
MREKDFKRRKQQPAQAEKTRARPLLLIRPRDFPLELHNFFVLHRVSPARTPSLKSALRILLNLSSVLLVVGTLWFLVSEASIHAYPQLLLTRAIQPPKCLAASHCGAPVQSTPLPLTAVTPAITQTPLLAVRATARPTVPPASTLTPAPQPSPQPTPSPTPSATVTPASALLQVVPVSLTISLAAVCDIGRFAVLTLTNAGGSPLIWYQDTANSSRGIRITDPTKTHLLEAGQSVNAQVSCRSILVVGSYNLALDYNGGVVNVAVIITL